MKKIILILTCLLFTGTFYAQSNDDLAKIYFKRADKKIYEELNPEEALNQFNKALKYTDTITKADIAWLGTRIHYELGNLKKAKSYAKHYFLLEKKKKSATYMDRLDLYITIEEEIEKQEIELKRLEAERLQKERELKRIDSLKTVWNKKSDALTLNVDSVYTFSSNNVAIFTKNNKYGILNDKGKILVNIKDYIAIRSFDGYILLLNDEHEPTKIYSFNTKTKQGFLLPSISDFNPLSTHYGQVMLPRGNGRVISYPNNSLKTFVYDLEARKFVRISNQKELFKDLKKTKKIDKYNKEGQVKLEKKWYNFGGHIGGGVHPLYNNDYSLYGFLCSIDGKILTQNNYNYLGAFYHNKLQAIKDDETLWVNQNGTKVKAPKDESGTYKGISKVKKLANGKYQILQNGFIILGNQKLEKMADFLRNNQK